VNRDSEKAFHGFFRNGSLPDVDLAQRPLPYHTNRRETSGESLMNLWKRAVAIICRRKKFVRLCVGGLRVPTAVTYAVLCYYIIYCAIRSPACFALLTDFVSCTSIRQNENWRHVNHVQTTYTEVSAHSGTETSVLNWSLSCCAKTRRNWSFSKASCSAADTYPDRSCSSASVTPRPTPAP